MPSQETPDDRPGTPSQGRVKYQAEVPVPDNDHVSELRRLMREVRQRQTPTEELAASRREEEQEARARYLSSQKAVLESVARFGWYWPGE